MGISVSLFKEIEKLSPDIKGVLLALLDEMDNSVKRDDFLELKAVVERIAIAQENNEALLKELLETQKKNEESIRELTKGQEELRQTVQNLVKDQEELREIVKTLTKGQEELRQTVQNLAKDQEELRQAIKELTEAQKKNEESIRELTKGQEELRQTVQSLTKDQEELREIVKRLSKDQEELRQIVKELAEAQKKTEESLQSLTRRVEHLEKRVDRIEKQLGGLSMAVGYGIEDKLYPHINNFVTKVFNIKPKKTILRYNLEYDEKSFDELNIYTECIKDQKECIAIGECKAKVGKKDVDRFITICQRVQTHTKKEVFKYLVGYAFDPIVEKYINTKYPELKYYKTYEIEHNQF